MTEAVIAGARVGAAHEGVAELVVTLAHQGGGTSEVALDHLATSALLASCDANGPDDLIGAPWQKVPQECRPARPSSAPPGASWPWVRAPSSPCSPASRSTPAP